MNDISVKLFYHLKEKAGIGEVLLTVDDEFTISQLKLALINKYPGLQSNLDNILISINQKIALDDDRIPKGAKVSFLTPIGGG